MPRAGSATQEMCGMGGTPQNPGAARGRRLRDVLLTPAPHESCRSTGTGGLDRVLMPEERDSGVLRAASPLPLLCSLPPREIGKKNIKSAS